jgi:hypothetical protein
MKKRVLHACDPERAGRYLLNRMRAEEETLFQEHLERCASCRAYVDAVRRLSAVVSDAEPACTVRPSAVRRKAAGLRLRTLASLAACFLLLGGLAVYFAGEGGGEMSGHRTSVHRRTVGDRDSVEVEMLFPRGKHTLMRSGETPVFRWNREAAYELTLRSRGRRVAHLRGEGSVCRPEAVRLRGLRELEWSLRLDGRLFEGTICFNTK